MNIRNVLRTYGLLRQLTDDETALLNTLRELNDSERELLVESLAPAKTTGKKAAKKSASKSQRASGMAAAIKKSLESQQRATPDICAYILPDTNHCMEAADNPIHDPTMGYRDYHSFTPPAARNATQPSSLNCAAQSSTASIEDETVSAGNVPAGLSGSDKALA